MNIHDKEGITITRTALVDVVELREAVVLLTQYEGIVTSTDNTTDTTRIKMTDTEFFKKLEERLKADKAITILRGAFFSHGGQEWSRKHRQYQITEVVDSFPTELNIVESAKGSIARNDAAEALRKDLRKKREKLRALPNDILASIKKTGVAVFLQVTVLRAFKTLEKVADFAREKSLIVLCVDKSYVFHPRISRSQLEECLSQSQNNVVFLMEGPRRCEELVAVEEELQAITRVKGWTLSYHRDIDDYQVLKIGIAPIMPPGSSANQSTGRILEEFSFADLLKESEKV